MGKNSLEKIINKKLDKRSPSFDYDSLWDELEPRLPKKRKKPFPFFLLFSALVLMGIIFVGLYQLNQNITTPTVNASQELVVKQAETKFDTEKTISTPTKDLAQEEHENRTTQEATPIETSKKESETQPQESYTQSGRSSQEISQHPRTGHPKTDFAFSSPVYGTRTTPIVATPSRSAAKDVTNSEDVSSHVPSTGNSVDQPGPVSQDMSTASTVAAPPVLKLSDLSMLKLQQKLSLLPSSPFSDLVSLTQPAYFDPVFDITEKKKDARKKIGASHWLQFSVGATVGFESFAALDGVDKNYEVLLSDPLSNLVGFSAALGYKLQLDNGLHIGVDGSLDRLYQKFEIHNEVSFDTEIYNEEAFVHNQIFIGAQQRGQVIQSQDILKYNSSTYVDIIPNFGYTFEGKLPLYVSVGPIFNISQRFSGNIVDPVGLVIQDPSLLFNRSVALQGLMVATGVRKDLTDKLSLMTNLNLRLRKNTTSDSNVFFDQSQNTLGLSFGLGYRL